MKTRTNQPVTTFDLEELNVEGKITGGEIVENMSGYRVILPTATGYTFDYDYVGICKNGNKLTFVYSVFITKTSAEASGSASTLYAYVPDDIFNKLYTHQLGGADLLNEKIVYSMNNYQSGVITAIWTQKDLVNKRLAFAFNSNNFNVNTKYHLRVEETYLLSDNLIPEQ